MRTLYQQIDHLSAIPVCRVTRRQWYDVRSLPYEDSKPKRQREYWNSKEPHICPHCRTNSASLQRDGKYREHLYCFICGWRESNFFDVKLLKAIKKAEAFERKYGAPVLLSNREAKDLERKRRNGRQAYEGNKEKRLAYQKQYNAEHQEQMREYQKNYREKHRA